MKGHCQKEIHLVLYKKKMLVIKLMVYKFVNNTKKPFMKLQSDDSVNVDVCGIWSLLVD